MRIFTAETLDEIGQIRILFREYEAFLNVDLCFQGFEAELAGLPGRYAPPDGLLLLASEGPEPAGCAALRKLDKGVCEMKRLYVKPGFRGQGLGTTLAKRLIDEAVQLGYHKMLLDTLDRLQTAMKLYESMGFVRIEPYYHNPLADVVFWKLDLLKLKQTEGCLRGG